MSDDASPVPVDVGDVTRRLAEIDRLLDTDNREPSQDHFALLKERDQLRGIAQTFRQEADRSRTTDQLRAERSALKSLLDQESRSRTGYVTSKGGGNHSPSPGAWVALGVKSLGAAQLNRVVARQSAIDDELQRRAE